MNVCLLEVAGPPCGLTVLAGKARIQDVIGGMGVDVLLLQGGAVLCLHVWVHLNVYKSEAFHCPILTHLSKPHSEETKNASRMGWKIARKMERAGMIH